MFIPGLESVSLRGEGQELCYPEAGTQTHLSTAGRVDSRLPSGPFPKQSNIIRRGKSCAVYLHKMFRKLLCYFEGFKLGKSQQFYSHLLCSANQIWNDLPKPC